jgi:hypothetical protein
MAEKKNAGPQKKMAGVPCYSFVAGEEGNPRPELEDTLHQTTVGVVKSGISARTSWNNMVVRSAAIKIKATRGGKNALTQ